ncbi:hypothetical protein TD95_000440 [Thielaviopsis punctulata]|uniref:Uncharacterized protein n=1 Tax=Thielaviopsis punctulata TaxID=72032 RepID=A0A0F4ZI15_9PEZI|nr:hypothetical protein TD95_000440 [Thielaviopsis punctulata]
MTSQTTQDSLTDPVFPLRAKPRVELDIQHGSREKDRGHDRERSLDIHDHDMSLDIDYDREKSSSREFATLINGASPLLSTSSNPVSGPPSPPPAQSRPVEFIPPTRPSSTPFPEIAVRDFGQSDTLQLVPTGPSSVCSNSSGTHPNQQANGVVGPGFHRLPSELHEMILDHVFGFSLPKLSTTSYSSPDAVPPLSSTTRRFTRRDLSDLALVCPKWRAHVQRRIYRHIKLKGTYQDIFETQSWFVNHPYLSQYVRHVEVWFPVFQSSAPYVQSVPILRPPHYINLFPAVHRVPFVSPSDNCSFKNVFSLLHHHFHNLKILTLEGGDRRKAPKVANGMTFNPPSDIIYEIPSVHTLITKGQWNLVRSTEDFQLIMSHLPNLREWHASYHKQKSKTYISMSHNIIPYLPRGLRALDIKMEADYHREIVTPQFYQKALKHCHLCPQLGYAVWSVSHLSYTGRICDKFFEVLESMGSSPEAGRLKSIDITIKNICRHYENSPDGLSTASGIQDPLFIQHFESLVISAVRSLKSLKNITYMRIRYVDLDSVFPPLNPYFILKDRSCYGVWSPAIAAYLKMACPEATFPESQLEIPAVLTTDEGGIELNPKFRRLKVKSFKMANYAIMHHAMGHI